MNYFFIGALFIEGVIKVKNAFFNVLSKIYFLPIECYNSFYFI